MDYKRCRSGFTLIELLVAISILAMVAVLGWRGLDGIVRARVALTAELEQTRGLQLAFAQLQSDAEHLASAANIGGRATLAAQDGRLTLIRTVFADDQPSRLQVVAYRIRDGVLSRRESAATRDLTALDALWQSGVSDTDADAAPAVVLQSAVSGMTMRLWLEDQNGVGWRADQGSASSTTSTTTSTSASATSATSTTGTTGTSASGSAASSTTTTSTTTPASGLEVVLQTGQTLRMTKIFLLGAS